MSLPTVLLSSILSMSSPAFAQFVQANPQPQAQPIPKDDTTAADPTVKTPQNAKKPNRPRCSTEISNGDCFVNVNRLYPYSYPGFLMKPRASVTVNVFNPFGFEKLTLELSAPATIYESTDQFGSLLTSLTPGIKGANANGNHVLFDAHFFAQTHIAPADFPPLPVTSSDLEKEITGFENDLTARVKTVGDAIDAYKSYNDQTTELYRQLRLVSLAVPRPSNDPDLAKPLNQQLFANAAQIEAGGKCFRAPDPWHKYDDWRSCMIDDLLVQGSVGNTLWGYFPNKCQSQAVPSTYWTVPTPPCQTDADGNTDSIEPTEGPGFSAAFDTEYSNLVADLVKLQADPNEAAKYAIYKQTADTIQQKRNLMEPYVQQWMAAVPATLTKQSPDMQNFYVALLNAPDDAGMTTPLGVLYGPSVLDPGKAVKKYLGVPVGLAPSVTYNVNAQNKVTTTLQQAPATSQRTLVAAIPLTFAEPRFETSSGVFLSMLNNRSFANTTDTCLITTGTTLATTTPGTCPTSQPTPLTPVPADVRITETVTNRPLFIPYYAAHYRIAPEWTWFGGRRGALYATGALAINPYLTDLEYAAGFSFSWRYLMFSPVYHLGRSTHLTQGEQPNQILCIYGTTQAIPAPPVCSGSPSAPTTKNYLTGAFAFGIGVRIPTTFSSTNK
ncbi:MAG: hypothetical protein WDN23_05290 [Edaphobacter sp.]